MGVSGRGKGREILPNSPLNHRGQDLPDKAMLRVNDVWWYVTQALRFDAVGAKALSSTEGV